MFTRRSDIMGTPVNRRLTTLAASGFGGVIIVLNVVQIVQVLV